MAEGASLLRSCHGLLSRAIGADHARTPRRRDAFLVDTPSPNWASAACRRRAARKCARACHATGVTSIA